MPFRGMDWDAYHRQQWGVTKEQQLRVEVIADLIIDRDWEGLFPVPEDKTGVFGYFANDRELFYSWARSHDGLVNARTWRQFAQTTKREWRAWFTENQHDGDGGPMIADCMDCLIHKCGKLRVTSTLTRQARQ